MPLEIERIFLTKSNLNNQYPDYENQLQPRILFNDNKLETLFEMHEQEIMQTAEQEIRDYVNCEDLCNDGEDMFPKRCVLTGEWYLSEINFTDVDYLSICTAFLGTDLGYKDDYLGLEVIFYYDVDSKKFLVDGVNSESL